MPIFNPICLLPFLGLFLRWLVHVSYRRRSSLLLACDLTTGNSIIRRRFVRVTHHAGQEAQLMMWLVNDMPAHYFIWISLVAKRAMSVTVVLPLARNRKPGLSP